jgi:hypothetical protein
MQGMSVPMGETLERRRGRGCSRQRSESRPEIRKSRGHFGGLTGSGESGQQVERGFEGGFVARFPDDPRRDGNELERGLRWCSAQVIESADGEPFLMFKYPAER